MEQINTTVEEKRRKAVKDISTCNFVVMCPSTCYSRYKAAGGRGGAEFYKI